jgi:hypothetical protein
MHELVRTDDGVHRTDISAMRTADAQSLVDKRDRLAHLGLRDFSEWHHVATQQCGQTLDRIFATRRTQIDRGRFVRDCRGVRAAPRVSALGALRLW